MLKLILFLLLMAIVFVVGFCVGCSWIFKRNFEIIKNQSKRAEKFRRMFSVLNCWLEYKEEGKDIADYFTKSKYNNVGIYGVGYLGKHLVTELRGTAVNISYIIDKKVEQIAGDIKIYKPENTLPETDVIVITAIMDYTEIVGELESKVKCPIISLEDVIFDR